MRIWSLHPAYLDPRGLVAAWREGLLALEVLRGNTKGYRHHPQLKRFQGKSNSTSLMKNYLLHVFAEAALRGYSFNAER